MNTYVPNYYHKFRCIADKCRHSCCIGWEIDIDAGTLEFYNSLEGSLAGRLKDAIACDGEPHFRLTEGDRCPFLTPNGLCDIICALGEDALCNICADHPRFRNFYSDAVEMGLGLCCEAAAELILGAVEPFDLVSPEGGKEPRLDEMESFVLGKRNKLIETMCERKLSVAGRHQLLLEDVQTCPSNKSFSWWCDFFLDLERLDEEWTCVLNKAKSKGIQSFFALNDTDYSIPLEQLTVYFLYRHMPEAIYDGDIASRVQFAVFSTGFIYSLALFMDDLEPEQGKHDDRFMSVLCNISRMYSAEIEYSDENLGRLLDELSRCKGI